MSAPAPRSTTSALNDSVHSAKARPARVSGKPSVAGIQCHASRNQVSTAAKAAAPASQTTLPLPPPAAALCRELMVSAVAVPVG